MKIEKVNENQIRCILSKEDLADRQIKLSELAYGSEKARNLFRDMIEQANDEFGFEVNDIPIMVEAIPLTGENIILQITKVEYPEELDTRFSKFSEVPEEDDAESAFDNSMFTQMQSADALLDKTDKPEKTKEITKMFVFPSLEQVERLAFILDGYYQGKNDLYKDVLKGGFYLIIRKSGHSPEEFNKICNIISEYAFYKKYTKAQEAFLKEHGKLILKENALQVFSLV